MLPDKIVLLRHGETAWNREGRFLGQSDPGLNEEGQTQAQAAAELLASQVITSIYSSDLRRALETAELIARKQNKIVVQIIPCLREINFGIWEGLTFAEIESSYPKLLSQWLEDPFRVRIPDGETANEVILRVQEAWNRISLPAAAKDTIAIVAHGGTLRMLANYLTGVDPSDQWAFNPGHGEIVILKRSESCLDCQEATAQLYRVVADF